jgi:hypothetical protein
MYDDLFVGMTIYHRTGKTAAIIKEINENDIKIELSKEISCKKTLTLPITHFGEWLFFKEEDVELNIEILADRSEYLKYNNRKIQEAHRNNIEKKKKIEEEKSRKEIELAEQETALIQLRHEFHEMFEREKQSKKQFIKILKAEHKFEGFHHYTDFTNFLNIMSIGRLLSRNEAQKCGFVDAAEQSVINRTLSKVKDYVRFYYKEKTPTIYDNEGIKVDNSSPHMPVPVLLMFDENIINYHLISFTSGCGGSKYSQITNNIHTAMDFDWESVFSRGRIWLDINNIKTLGYDPDKASVINKRNAEFLVYKEVDIKHIEKIIFRSPADKKRAIMALGENKLFKVDSNKFNNHRNYLYDYDIVNNNGRYNINQIFNANIDNYSHELKITYKDGFSESVDILENNKKFINKRFLNDHSIIFDFVPVVNRIVNKIEYFMNGHLCALWEDRTND